MNGTTDEDLKQLKLCVRKKLPEVHQGKELLRDPFHQQNLNCYMVQGHIQPRITNTSYLLSQKKSPVLYLHAHKIIIITAICSWL